MLTGETNAGANPFTDNPDLPDAELLESLHGAALQLMRTHGLTDWGLVYSTTSQRRLGRTYYALKRIELQVAAMLGGTGADRLDVVLHEIAHALCPAGEGHGPAWRARARALGARQAASADHPVSAARFAKVQARCPTCGHLYGVSRKPSGAWYCNQPACRRHTPLSKRALTWQRMKVSDLFDADTRAVIAKHQAPASTRAPLLLGGHVQVDLPQ